MGYEKRQKFARCKLAGRVDFLGQQRIVLGKVIGAQILLWGTESFTHVSLCPDCLLFGLVAEQDRILRFEKNRGQQPLNLRHEVQAEGTRFDTNTHRRLARASSLRGISLDIAVKRSNSSNESFSPLGRKRIAQQVDLIV